MSEAILLSGGLDSTALAYWCRPSLAITIDYGQVSAKGELRAATQVAEILKIDHEIIRVDCRSLGSGDLAGQPPVTNAPAQEWWPFRNQLLITLALMKAFNFGINELLVGTVKSDGFHADGTTAFVNTISQLAEIQEGGMHVKSPAIELTTAELVRTSQIPMSILAWSHSCHTGEWACGVCRGCCKHRLVMDELGYDSY